MLKRSSNIFTQVDITNQNGVIRPKEILHLLQILTAWDSIDTKAKKIKESIHGYILNSQ